MKAHGVDRQDSGCCPEHDKFSQECYNSRRSEQAPSKARKISRSRTRISFRTQLIRELTFEEHD